MKKKYSVLLLAALLMVCFAMSGFTVRTKMGYVTDDAGLFTDSQLVTLSNKAARISETYNIGVYIITVQDYHTYYNTGRIEECLFAIYDNSKMGLGSDHSATTMMLSMADRDYALDFYGDRAHYAFTEGGRDYLEDTVIPYFRDNDFYGGFNTYLDMCEEYLQAAENGEPVQGAPKSPLAALFAAIPGGIGALLTGLFMSSSMRSASLKRDANDYVVKGSLNLERRSDMFLNRTVSRSPRQSSSSSASGSSHHYSSGGHSGRSGKF